MNIFKGIDFFLQLHEISGDHIFDDGIGVVHNKKVKNSEMQDRPDQREPENFETKRG